MAQASSRAMIGDRFSVRRVLGEGASGIVYEADDRVGGGRIALKRLKHVGPEGIRRIKAEFRTAADLRHSSLVQLHELLAIDDDWFISMDLVDGEDLVEYVRGLAPRDEPSEPDEAPAPATAVGRLDEDRLRACLAQLVDGVRAIHRAGMLHRDLKPSNIRVGRDGRLRILDFGLAVALSADRSGASGPRIVEQTGDMVGTPMYMAPEQADGPNVGPPADWYAVGAVLFRALTGRPPFDGDTWRILSEKLLKPPPDPQADGAHLPADLCDLCRQLMAQRPEDRPSGDELAERCGLDSAPPQLGRELLGREAELALLGEALERSRRDAHVVLISGTSGMGKSALCARFLEEAERQGVLVLHGRCLERESLPYNAIDRVVDAVQAHLSGLGSSRKRLLPEDGAALAKVFPVLAAVRGLSSRGDVGVDVVPHVLRRRAFAALRELVGAIAASRRVAIMIDDLQWGDADSAELLEDLLRGPGAPPVLLLAAFRREDELRGPAVVALRRRGGATEIELGPLAAADAEALARRSLGDVELDVLQGIARESAGSPFFIEELCRAGVTGARPSIEGLVARRLEALAPIARRILEAVAVAGGPLGTEVAARLAEGNLTSATTELRAASLLRARGPRDAQELDTLHDRVRQAVVAALGPADLRARHGALAAALEAAGDSVEPERLAMHYRHAGDRARASRHAARAAERALTALAFERAAALFRGALADAADAERPPLAERLGGALADAGRSRESAAAYLEAAGVAAELAALELRQRAAAQLLSGGHLEEGAEVIRAALVDVGLAYPETPGRAIVSMLLRRAHLRLRGLGARDRSWEALPPLVRARVELCWAAGQGLSNTDMVRGMDFLARHLLLALDAGDPHRVARGLAVEAIFTAGGGDVRRARKLLDRAAAIAGQDTTVQVWVELGEGVLALAGYRFREVADRLAGVPAFATGREGRLGWELGSAQFFGLLARTALGEVAEVTRRVDLAIRVARDRGDLHTESLLGTFIRPWAQIARGELEDAEQQLDEVLARWAPGFMLQHGHALLTRTEIDLYRGDAARAVRRFADEDAALRRSQIQRIRIIDIRVHELRGRALLGAGDERGAEASAARLEKHRAAYPDWLAAMLRAGVALRRSARDRGVQLLARAERGAADTAMPLYEHALRRRRGEVLGDATLVSDADDRLRALGVVSPARYAAALVPGIS